MPFEICISSRCYFLSCLILPIILSEICLISPPIYLSNFLGGFLLFSEFLFVHLRVDLFCLILFPEFVVIKIWHIVPSVQRQLNVTSLCAYLELCNHDTSISCAAGSWRPVNGHLSNVATVCVSSFLRLFYMKSMHDHMPQTNVSL